VITTSKREPFCVTIDPEEMSVNFNSCVKGSGILRTFFVGCYLILGPVLTYAAGPNDGIYQAAANSTKYVSLHQNGNTLIAAIYDSVSNSSVGFSTARGTIVPSKLDYWDVYSGQVIGNSVQLSGQTGFTGCSETLNITFGGSGTFTAIFQGITPTQAGVTAGLNCSAGNPPIGSTLIFTRVF